MLLPSLIREHSSFDVNCTDWVEHALETDLDPYLRTPEEEMSFVARHNLDVYPFVAVAAWGAIGPIIRQSYAMAKFLVPGLMKVGRPILIQLGCHNLVLWAEEMLRIRWRLTL